MANRKTCREALAALFSGQGFNAVYDYAPNDLAGATKILVVYTDATRHDMISKHLNNDFYSFFLDVYIKRAGAAAEDDLDTLHEVIRATCRANVGTANWDHLTLNQESDAFFAEVAGVPYRVERHTVTVKAQS